MKGALLSGKKLSDCEKWILKEGKRLIRNFYYIPINEVVVKDGIPYFRGKSLRELDFIIPRLPRVYSWIGFQILDLLREDVYFPILPESLILSHNKFLTLVVLSEFGIPVPKTYLSLTRKTLEKIVKKIGFPVVFKLLYGSLGRGVMFGDSFPSAISIMDALERFKEPIFVEEYIPHKGEDIRVFVLGERTIAEKRIAKKGERRTNLGIGGRGVYIKNLDPEIREISLKASKALGMQISGIDVIESEKGPVVIEANVNVHFEGLTKVSGISIAREIVKFVRDEYKKTKIPKLKRLIKWIKSPRF